jgi:hypothetical protein
MRSAAWRISLWATLAFAIGTMLVFVMLHRFVAHDIQRRSDAWLAGEVEVLGDVAERTPKDRVYGRVVGEIAELASREVPNRQRASGNENESVFSCRQQTTGRLSSGSVLEMERPTWRPSGPRRLSPTCLTTCKSKVSAIRFE